MPRDERWVVCRLSEQINRPAQQIGTEKVLHGAQDPGMADQLGQPPESDVALVPKHFLNHAVFAVEGALQACAIVGHLLRRQNIDGTEVSIPPEIRHIES